MSKHYGEIVKAYRNLHNKEGTGYSVQRNDRVISKRGGVQRVVLSEVVFNVRPGGHAAYHRGGCKAKNVHAFAIGTLVEAEDYIWPAYSQTSEHRKTEEADLRSRGYQKAGYQPKGGQPAFTINGYPIKGASRVILCSAGMWVLGPRWS